LPLPHAYPFLLLDRIVAVQAGAHACAIKNLVRGDPLLDANGFLPPVLLVEAMAEVAGIACVGSYPGRNGMLARVDRFRSRTTLAAGDRLEVSARILKTFGAVVRARAVVRVAGRVRAAGEIVLHLSKDSPHRSVTA